MTAKQVWQYCYRWLREVVQTDSGWARDGLAYHRAALMVIIARQENHRGE